MSALKPRRIVLGVTGSIAAYKAAEIVRLFTKSGVEVECVLTRAATAFVQPLTFATLSERPVTVELFGPAEGGAAAYGERSSEGRGPAGSPQESVSPSPGPPPEVRPIQAGSSSPPSSIASSRTVAPGLATSSSIEHIRASRGADLVVVAPATANILGKVAAGIADDALSTTILASSAPVLFAPAMNTIMWNHPAVQENVRTLRRWGYLFVDPGEGDLACGEYGAGRMAEPEDVVGRALRILAERRGAPRLLVSAGGTEEDLDPVRCLSNHSSGRMGFAVAEAGRDLGLRVTVVAGRTTAPVPHGVELLRVRSAREMKEKLQEIHLDHDILVMAAAVADYRPARVQPSKIPSGAASLSLDLVPTDDILAKLAPLRRGKVTVGFALETDSTRQARVTAGREKLARKGVDFLVVNDPTRPGSEFGGGSNEVTLLHADGSQEDLPVLDKVDVGRVLLSRALELHGKRAGARPAKRTATVKRSATAKSSGDGAPRSDAKRARVQKSKPRARSGGTKPSTAARRGRRPSR